MTGQTMKLTSAHSLQEADITGWELSGSSLKLIVSRVGFNGRLYRNAEIIFPLLRPVTAMCYDETLNRWVDAKSSERLKNICGLHFKLEIKYSLKGLGAESGKLIALNILSRNPTINWTDTLT